MRVVAAIGLVCASTLAYADSDDVPGGDNDDDDREDKRPIAPGASSTNKPGFQSPAELTGTWGGVRSDLYDAGVAILPSYAIELFGTPSLDADRTAFAGLASLELDLDLAKLIDARFGRFYAEGFAIHGDYRLDERLHDVFGISNNVARPDVRLFEAWIDQPIGPLKVRAGLLSADQQFLISNQSSALISPTFGITAMFAVDLVGPVYPVATPGLSVRYPSDALTVRAAVYDGDQINAHGIPTALGDHVLGIAEATVAGTFKLGGWHHTSRGSAVYAVLDHELDENVGAFARAAVASKGPIEIYADAGIRISPGKRRPHDVASIGLAFADGAPGAQTLVEGTYQVALTGWLVLQPDVQVIFRREGPASVLGTRLLVTF
jgi:porin